MNCESLFGKVSNTPEKSQIKFDEGPQIKIDENICQSCEERLLQIKWAPFEWSTSIEYLENIEFKCQDIRCKWHKN